MTEAYAMSGTMYQPNFLFIGPDKSGSTWIYDVLDWHPQVFMSRAKELFYFDYYYHLGPDWYLKHFKAAKPHHRVIGEVSHDYLYHEEACRRIAETLPDVRLMACLREPVERAFSSYLYMYKQGRLSCSFEEALGTVDELVEHGLYGKLLTPYVELFGSPRVLSPSRHPEASDGPQTQNGQRHVVCQTSPTSAPPLPRRERGPGGEVPHPRQLHIALFDDLQADSDAFAQAMFDFLEIDRMPLPKALLKPSNAASRPRLFPVARIARQVGVLTRNLGRPEIVTKVKSSSLVQRLLYREYTRDDRPRLVAQTREGLKYLFVDDVERLSELLQVNMVERWGYETHAKQSKPGLRHAA